MARTRTVSEGDRQPSESLGYEYLATRPLHILAFLAPLLLAYEIGTIVVVMRFGADQAVGLEAHRLIATIFESFGVVSIHLPAIALATTLLIWHLITLDPWRIRLRVLGGMLVESAAWTMPMLLLAMVVGPALAAAEPTVSDPIGQLSPLGRLTISIGAGLYEEMLFRLILIAVLHAVLVDLLGMREMWGRVLAVIGAAVAFAMFHDLSTLPPDARLGARLYLLMAGAYLGLVYVLRGLGIVVGVHALFDAIVLLAMTDSADGV